MAENNSNSASSIESIIKKSENDKSQNEISSDNFKENNNIEVVVDDLKTTVEIKKESKTSPQQPTDWYKQYEDKIYSQAQAHRNAVLAASLQYLKPIERERFLAQLNSFNNPTRLLTPPPSSSSSSSSSSSTQQNISPSSTNSNSSTTNETLIERYYTSTISPYQVNNYNNNNNKSLNSDQDKLIAAHQAIIAQYAQQFNVYQAHGPHFQHPLTHHTNSSFSTPTPTDPRLYQSEKDRHPLSTFNLYTPGHIFSNRDSSKPLNPISTTSTSSLSIDEQRVSPHTNSYDDNMDEDNDDDNGDDGENQSLNDTNGEWTYEEQFKQVNCCFFCVISKHL
jgi:hypothetical protein